MMQTSVNIKPITRELQTLTSGQPVSDGDGVKMTRIIGTPELNMLDPFLLLDAFETDQAQDQTVPSFSDHRYRLYTPEL